MAYYQVSPWAIFFNDENYYLVTYDEDKDKMLHKDITGMYDG